MLSRYSREHLDAHRMARRHLEEWPDAERDRLLERLRTYLDFRKEVQAFQEKHFSRICTLKCFQDRTSACCAREGIAAFFADVVVNALLSTPEEIDILEKALTTSLEGPSCVYLGPSGCLWRMKPVACEMFLCDHALDAVLAADDTARDQWEQLRARERLFTWPDRPVLFDGLETLFMNAGLESPLMYCHKSPGLMRVKKRAGLEPGGRPA